MEEVFHQDIIFRRIVKYSGMFWYFEYGSHRMHVASAYVSALWEEYGSGSDLKSKMKNLYSFINATYISGKPFSLNAYFKLAVVQPTASNLT